MIFVIFNNLNAIVIICESKKMNCSDFGMLLMK